VKVSLRSVGDVDVAAFSKRFGGGGHTKAAGLALPCSLAGVQSIVLAAARAFLRENGSLRRVSAGRPTSNRAYIPERTSRNCRPETMDTIDRIEKTLDTLRPYIASHRGHVEIVDFDEHDGTLLVRLGGTCHGCAASTVTLKQGIEVRLRESVPEVKHVEAV